MLQKFLILALVMIVAAPAVLADRREFAWTYQYATIAPGAAELEFYQTTKLDKTNSWEYRIEVEHGISPKADFSVYQIFSQKEGEDFRWDAFQIRGRYKLAEPGKFFFDPLLYLEYQRKIDLHRQNKAEVKLILSRDFDRWSLAINPLYEFFWAPGDPVHEIGFDAGLSYEVSYSLTLGVESVVRAEYFKNQEDEQAAYFGPSFSWAPGSMYYTVGYLWGLNDDANDARVRFLMGVTL